MFQELQGGSGGSGGTTTYEYVHDDWPEYGGLTIPTTQKAKAFVIADNWAQVWFAEDGDTYCTRDDTVQTSFPVTFNSNNITIGGNYGAPAQYKGYVIY